MATSSSPRQLVRRLLGEAPLCGWTIADVRSSSGIRVTLARAAEEVVIVLRPAGREGFLSTARLSAMMVGRSQPAQAPLLAEIERRLRTSLSSFAPGEIEDALEKALHRLAPVEAARVEERSHRPGEAELRLNLACNQACFFCNCDGYAPNVVPEASVAVDTARRLGARGVETLVISGGEPTLHHALLEVARAAREGGVPHVMVQTNAVKLAEPGLATRLRDAGVSMLFVSLHSHRADVSDRITGVAGTHALTARGIDAALESGMSVITNFVINSLNLAEPPVYVGWLRDRFRGALSGRVFSFMAPVAAALNNLPLMPRIADALPPLRAALDDCLRAGEWVRIAGVCGLPLCVLGGYEQLSDEFEHRPGVTLADDRMKLDGCADCAHEQRCSGIWRRYVERYGGSEFVPVDKA